MKLILTKQSMTCEDLSKLLGYKVNQVTIDPDGNIELDLDVASLTATKKATLITKLNTALSSLSETTPKEA